MHGTDLAEILMGSGTIPHQLHANNGTLEFVALERTDLQRLSFHDGRDFATAQIKGPFRLADVAVEIGPAVAPGLNYIFHSAFCCSTLLARCFDINGRVFSLREPKLILDLANLKRFKHPLHTDATNWQQVGSLALSLLARPAVDGERVLIKPTNIANNIIPDLLAMSPDSKAILLYSDLRSFLVSLIKKGEPGRAFGRQTFHILNMDSDLVRDIPTDMMLRMTDLQIVVLLWRLQMSLFADVLATSPKDRVVSLDSKSLLQEPKTILGRVADFYGFGFSDQEIEEIATGSLFSRHAKEADRSFDAAERSAENQRVEDEHGQVLDQLVAWEKTVKPERALPWPLPNAL